MKYKPILFKGEMVRAILSGQKTQTRRLTHINDPKAIIAIHPIRGYKVQAPNIYQHTEKRPKYEVGDILWVRETWRPKTHRMPIGSHYEYRATAKEDGTPEDGPWKASLYMPKSAARIFLEVTAVYVEPLLAITNEDAIAEGVKMLPDEKFTNYQTSKWQCSNAVDSYFSLWDYINGDGAHLFNPIVWVYEFRRVDDISRYYNLNAK